MNDLDSLIVKVQNHNSDADFSLIRKAYEFAMIAHAGQKRYSGEPVIIHPLAVANILADYHLGSVSIAAGLLHDVVEDSNVSLSELEREFGREIAGLVEGVTKISQIKLRGSSDEEFVENLRKMLLAMAKDLRVILVKLADRLHNMQTLQYLPLEKQFKNAKETLEVYGPLAERLGMGEIKGQLEDLAFPYVFPQDYQWVINYSKPHYRKAEEFLKKSTRVIYKELAKEGIRAKITSRPKHLYSLWQKLLRPEINRDISRVYDLVAMRILVETVRDCYAALGIIHSHWKPVPNQGISDFIAQPKPNGYRSLHTKVFSLDERILEIQIRTFEMHEEAENGIAAHWFYANEKNKSKVNQSRRDEGFFVPGNKLAWVKQLVSWQKEVVGSQEFMEALKFDALAHRIFVFSPKGDVYDLPQGATPVDFAYAIHSSLGNETQAAIINGKMVALDYKLRSGDLVKIINKEGGRPSEKWLRFVVTQQARRHIARHCSARV
ncbi:MAG TPA: RelA/SpoT family protein [Patescibacteria group bacterium]|nr:RelA/SpoT family protein [Patescibacteria group bacterium]